MLVREAAERARRRAPGVRFDLDLQPTVIDAAAEQVARAIGNVIDNACKWSPPGARIVVELHGCALSVRDHGPGFHDKDLEHVFDRFYRADDARRMPGSGLGLAIVKQAADAHRGEARARNAPGGGALVEVSFGSPTQLASGTETVVATAPPKRRPADHLAFGRRPGGVAERLNAAVSKTVVRLIGVPGVRISPPPLVMPNPPRLRGIRPL